MHACADQPDYLSPYQEAIRTHGASFRATLWNSREYQQLRFQVFSEMTDLTGRVIADAGCALADLAVHLHENDIQYGRYIGIDAIPELLAEARSRKLPEAEYIEADFVADAGLFARLALADHPPDLILFSGSLNTFERDRAITILDRAWDAAREGVVFNFLSTRGGLGDTAGGAVDVGGGEKGDDPARRFDPIQMLEWALTKTTRVALRHDYLPTHDATIAMLRPGA